MGLFGNVGARFKRTMWKSVQNLADELFGVFTSNDIDLSPRTITINQPDGATLPPLVINQPEGSTVPPIQVTRGNTTISVGGTGEGGGGGGGIDLGEIEWPGQNPGEGEEATPPSALNPIALHGIVAG